MRIEDDELDTDDAELLVDDEIDDAGLELVATLQVIEVDDDEVFIDERDGVSDEMVVNE